MTHFNVSNKHGERDDCRPTQIGSDSVRRAGRVSGTTLSLISFERIIIQFKIHYTYFIKRQTYPIFFFKALLLSYMVRHVMMSITNDEISLLKNERRTSKVLSYIQQVD